MHDLAHICDGRRREYVYREIVDSIRSLHCWIARQYHHGGERESSDMEGEYLFPVEKTDGAYS